MTDVIYKEWRCFHCDEVFTTIGAAEEHFGTTEGAEPGCKIDQVAVEEGGKPERGRGLLMALRKAEAEIRQLRHDCEELENDSRLWHESEADRVRRIGHVQWWQELDSREGERLVLIERATKAEQSLETVKGERDTSTLKALANSGIDTECGACMEVAFTGATTNAHTCHPPTTVKGELELREALIDAYWKAKDSWSAQCFCFTSATEALRRDAHEVAREGFERQIDVLGPIVRPWLNEEYWAAVRQAREESATSQNAEAGAVDDASSVGAQNSDLRRALTTAEQSLETVKGERERMRDVLTASRDVLAAFQKQAGYLPGQQAYSTRMTQGELDLSRAVTVITAILSEQSSALRERPQDGVLGFVDRAVVTDFQRRVETAQEGHRCSGCGHRWEDDPQRLRGVELCGDCWRKGQSAIFSRESATPPPPQGRNNE